ncbi:MAG: response regulator [Deltaproteobacteria bacterium]|nr:response regulator [Deltaproteobacteria bacterium]
MPDDDILKDKRILIVDDEPDILETLEDLLDICLVDTAPDFETGKKSLKKNVYDAAIFDIMGVRGYELLKLAKERNIPALMLTAHALNPEALMRSIKEGAQSYVPKDKMAEIPVFVKDMLLSRQKGIKKQGRWFTRLKPFFDKEFGREWRKNDEAFWKEFDATYAWRISKDELGDIM